MTLAFQKVDYLAKDIPLLRADGSATTLGAEAGAEVVAVIPWASINCGSTLDFVNTVAPIAAGIPGLQLMPVSIDRVQTDDDRKVLHQVLVEAAVEQPLIVDRELKLLSLINARWDGNRPGVNALRLPPLVLISGDLQRLEFPELQSTGARVSATSSHPSCRRSVSRRATPGRTDAPMGTRASTRVTRVPAERSRLMSVQRVQSRRVTNL